MSKQHPAGDNAINNVEMDEFLADDEPVTSKADANIYKKDSIDPAKRRRLEAMREERELMRDLKDVFDDYDFDD